MTINIRSGCFETNSSSTHSIVLRYDENDDKDFNDSLICNEEGNLILEGKDFTGVQFEISGAESKATLIATIAMVNDDQSLRKRLESVLREHTGASRIIYDIRLVTKDKKPANAFFCPNIASICYYDEDDKEFTLLDLLKKKEFIKRFIFNKNIIIEGGEIYD